MGCFPAISANAILLEIATGFFVGIGVAMAWYLVGWPFRRWA